MKKVRAFAPATVANFVCGYDVLGFALNNCGDEVELSLNESNEITFELAEPNEFLSKLKPEQNVVYAMVKLFMEKQNITAGVHICLYKKMPLNSGMGSSSASSVAALVAVNALFGNPLTKQQLLPFAMEGERLACGNAHADNVAPALFGGIVLISSYQPLEIVQLNVPKNLYASIIHPHINVPTSDARKIIKEHILLKDAVVQWGNVGGLIAGLYTNDYALIGKSMQDVIIEPSRALLIPYFYEIKKIAMNAGALGIGISGSGPSVFALNNNQEVAETIATDIQKFLASRDIKSDQFVSDINLNGAITI